jgi:hypothetical protein
MREPRSYIVRIYRQGYRSLAGTVEDTRSGTSRGFRNTRELAVLLRGSIQAPNPLERKAVTDQPDRRDKP